MQLSVRTSDNFVVQSGHNLGDLAGCEILDITDEEHARFESALALSGSSGVRRNVDGTFTPLPPPAPKVDRWAADKALLAAYHANPAPTNADSVAALKALIRVVRGIAS